MAVRYHIGTMKVGFGKEKKEAYVGQIQLGETVETDMIVEQIHLRTGLAKAQIKMVLENMTDSIQHFCKMGNGVRLGGLGIIKPALKSKSSEKMEDVEVLKLRYRFLPSVEMKNALRALEVRKLGDSSDDELNTDEEEDEEGAGGESSGEGGKDFE